MEKVTFTTDDGYRLEGDLRRTEGEQVGTAVICHPHPRQGGSKDHPLLWAIRNHLATEGRLSVLSFNFRGVMRSEGTYGGGRDELRDVAAAVGAVRASAPAELPTVLVGWSFGASVALRHALDDPRVRALALVGMPLEAGDLALPPLPEAVELRHLKRPVLLIAGENDAFCPPDEMRAFAEPLPMGEVRVIPGTDHYFWRREAEAAAYIGGSLGKALAG